MRYAAAAPSLLSALRLALTPATAHAILTGAHGRALTLFAVAAFTDGLDGWIARRFRLTTRFGAVLDPIADKILLSTIYICLGFAGEVPLWLVGIVFGRDVFIVLLAVVGLTATTIRDFPPSVWGKLSTLLQVATAVAVLAEKTGEFGWLGGAFPWLFLLVGAAAFWSAGHYLVAGYRRAIGTGGRTG